jgi:hypothetical protein
LVGGVAAASAPVVAATLAAVAPQETGDVEPDQKSFQTPMVR